MNGPAHDLLTTAELARRADFALGEAWVSPSTRILRGPGGEGSLEPRAMQVLVTLAEALGSVVTRDELFRRCWGAAVVGDDSLNRAIADIRRLARDVAGGAFRIETVPRTGYRLLDATGPETAAQQPRAIDRRWIMGLGAVAVVGSGMALWSVRPVPARSRATALVEESEAHMRTGVPQGHARAVQALERAVSLDPRNATAWGRLALARCALSETSPPREAAALVVGVEQAARRALDLQPRQPDALGARAILPPYFGDWAVAEKRLDSVLAVAPNHIPTRDARAFLLISVGRGRENLAERTALATDDPLDAVLLYRLIYAHWIAGRIEDADRAADRALQLWPTHPGVWFARLWTLAFTGRADRALAHVQEAGARPQDLPAWMLETLAAGMRALISGEASDRAAAISRLISEVSQGPSLSVNALLLLNGLGEIDLAYDVARAYLLEEGPLMASVRWRPGKVAINDQRRRKTHMLFLPVAARMRADPRFADLVDRVGLSAYWRTAGVRPDYQLAS